MGMMGLTPTRDTMPTSITTVGCNASGRRFIFLVLFPRVKTFCSRGMRAASKHLVHTCMPVCLGARTQKTTDDQQSSTYSMTGPGSCRACSTSGTPAPGPRTVGILRGTSWASCWSCRGSSSATEGERNGGQRCAISRPDLSTCDMIETACTC